ncbi:hypothetical protein P9112_002241 [Eukaryota sp. TZLM1-RC]
MFKCYNFNCKVEPLLKHYSDNNLFDSRRGDLIAPFVDSSQVVVDFFTVDPFASIYRDDVFVSFSGHLDKAESGLNFLHNFDILCRLNGKNFAGYLWKNCVIFALCRNVPKYLNLMMSKLYKDSSRVDVENFVSYVF